MWSLPGDGFSCRGVFFLSLDFFLCFLLLTASLSRRGGLGLVLWWVGDLEEEVVVEEVEEGGGDPNRASKSSASIPGSMCTLRVYVVGVVG